MSPVKLTYFNLKGRAELARLILAQAEAQYEDRRITKEEWLSLKPSKSQISTDSSHQQSPSHSPGPILEVKGRTIAQSFTIARYLARQHGLAGNNELLGSMADLMREKDEQKKADMKKVFSSETLPGWLTMLERLLTRRGGKYFAGGELTWADLAVFNVIDNMNGRLADFNIEEYPNLDKLTVMVRELPNISKWLQERPDTPF